MPQQSVIDKLSSRLLCSPARAREFGNEVNWLLRQCGHQAMPIDQIYQAVSFLDLFTITAQDVVTYIVGPPEPTPDGAVLATLAHNAEHTAGEQEQKLETQPATKAESASSADPYPVTEVILPLYSSSSPGNDLALDSLAEVDGGNRFWRSLQLPNPSRSPMTRSKRR